jgi:hypothetical protein
VAELVRKRKRERETNIIENRERGFFEMDFGRVRKIE